MKRLTVALFFVGFSALSQAQLPTYNISTVAGSSVTGVRDGGNAAVGILFEPRDAVTDKDGNIYIADFAGNRVRKIAKDTSVITTVAGNGRPTGTNTAGPGATTAVRSPNGFAYDATRNVLYIASKDDHTVKKLDLATGVVSLFAGIRSSGYTGDGRLAKDARLRSPSAVAVDSAGNVYIADTRNNRIRKVYIDTLVIKTVAGIGPEDSNGSYDGDGGRATLARLNNPEGVAVAKNGNIFIADTQSHKIRMVDVNCSGCADTKGIISTLAGICVTNIKDYNGNNVSCPVGTTGSSTGASPAGGNVVSAVAAPPGSIGAGKPAIKAPFIDGVVPSQATLNSPRGLAIDAAGDLLIADTASTDEGTGRPAANRQGTGRIRMIKNVPDGSGGNTFTTISTIAGGGIFNPAGTAIDGRVAAAAQLNSPRGVSVDALGNMLIADTGNLRVRYVDATSQIISTLAGGPVFGGDGGPASGATFSDPRGVAVDLAGNLFIADTNNNRVRKVSVVDSTVTTIAGTGAGGNSGDGGLAISAQLNGPTCIAFDATAALLIADRANNRIRKIDAAGNISTVAGGFVNATGATVAADGIGNLATHTSLSGPRCVAADKTGNYYIADTGNHVVRKVLADGTTSVFAGVAGTSGTEGDGGPATEAYLNGPQGLALDSLNTYLFISDTGNHVVRRVNLSTNNIDTIIGVFTSGDSDNVPASPDAPTISQQARVNTPVGLAVDSKNNLFIADSGSTNNRIVRVDNATSPYGSNVSRVAGGGSGAGVSGAALDAQIFNPRGIVVDALDNVIFTDALGIVRKITPNK